MAICEFLLPSDGSADHLLHEDSNAARAIKAEKEGTTPGGVEIQSDKYSQGLKAVPLI